MQILMNSSASAKSLPAPGLMAAHWAVMLAAGLAYALPWIVNPGASLTLNAYDLAEWASLHPEVRAGSPAMMTSLLLRAPLVCLAVIVSVRCGHGKRLELTWVMGCLAVAIAGLILLPPIEFFSDPANRGDANYRQQLSLGLFTWIGGAIGLSGIIQGFSPVIVLSFSAAGFGCCLFGLEQANRLMLDLVLPAQRGLGGIFMSVGFLSIALLESGAWLRKSKQGD